MLPVGSLVQEQHGEFFRLQTTPATPHTRTHAHTQALKKQTAHTPQSSDTLTDPDPGNPSKSDYGSKEKKSSSDAQSSCEEDNQEQRNSSRQPLGVSGPLDLSRVFRLLEENKSRLAIVNYSVSQDTLEQIFIQFAREQEEERGEVGGL